METGNLLVPYANETDHYDCECHVQDSKHLRAERSWCLAEAMTRGLMKLYNWSLVQILSVEHEAGVALNSGCRV